MIFSKIKSTIEDWVNQFDTINQERKNVLKTIASYIQNKVNNNQNVSLIYICTHNSRRSHFGQVWAKVAATYYGIENVYTFSGGTEATAFNSNAIEAFKRIGFIVQTQDLNDNPIYELSYDDIKKPIICFSKVYNDKENPSQNFAAIMTCSDAEQNCPLINGAELRIATTYDDPKAFDHTELCQLKYDERCKQIAIETLYIFSQIKIN